MQTTVPSRMRAPLVYKMAQTGVNQLYDSLNLIQLQKYSSLTYR